MKLVRYDAARTALQLASRVDEVKDIRDKAQAMAAYARQANDTELLEWATEIKVRAERRAGEMLRDMDKARGGRPPKTGSSLAPVSTLSDLGIDKHQSSRWQKLAAISEDKFEQAVAAAKEVAGEVTTAALLRLNGAHPGHNSGDNEWYTPGEYIAAATGVLGAIDLDPASTTEANAIVAATRFYSAKDDGLAREWKGRVWLNPPYSSELIGLFMGKLVASYVAGEVSAAVTLTNNATETAWFAETAEQAAALCLPRGRIKFWHPRKQSAPLQGQAFFYLGKNAAAFAAKFRPFGSVWVAA